MALEHEVPTHLEVEDKPFFGLTMPQFVTLFLGLATTAFFYNYALNWLPVAARIAVCGVLGLLVLASVFIRPNGRALSDWLLERIQFHFGVHLAIYGLRELLQESAEAAAVAAAGTGPVSTTRPSPPEDSF